MNTALMAMYLLVIRADDTWRVVSSPAPRHICQVVGRMYARHRDEISAEISKVLCIPCSEVRRLCNPSI